MVKLKNDMRIYVEGGGFEFSELDTELRQAFSTFFEKAGLSNRKPRVIPCGSRENAFRDFKLALAEGRNALLLVDSEIPVDDAHYFLLDDVHYFLPWAHLKASDRWDKPNKAKDEDCHLMVQCMESWFIADWKAVSAFFGKDFRESAKPAQRCEKHTKSEIFAALKKATQDCKKGKYDKGQHSFKILASIKSDPVLEDSPWAKRFIKEIAKRKSVP